MIELTVCGCKVRVSHSSLECLMIQENIDKNGVAIAINEQVIPKSQWERVVLSNGDSVEFFSVVAGG